MNLIWFLLSLLVVLVVFPILLYIWGTMFGKGFMSGIIKYINKLKIDKNEQKEN